MGNTSSKTEGSVSEDLRIVSVGKTGVGKSHTGNTILGDPKSHSKPSSSSDTQKCTSKITKINGRIIRYVDTPGFFDISRSEDELKPEIVRSIVECSPGPHAFLIILKVERYTVHEKETVTKITETFGEEAFKYAVVLFTHGDDLKNNQTIKEFVDHNSELQKLVHKCGGRCHVIDNKYWNKKHSKYRSNKFQVKKLLNTIENMMRENGGDFYTNEMLQEVEKKIQATVEEVREESNGAQSEENIRDEVKERVRPKLATRLAGVATGVLVGALLGIKPQITSVLHIINKAVQLPLDNLPAVTTATNLLVAAVVGGFTASKAVEGEETVMGAVQKAAEACSKAEEQDRKGTMSI